MLLIDDGSPVKTKDGMYRTIRDWQFKHDRWGILTVPSGYKTDLASIPQWSRFLFWGKKEEDWQRGLWDVAAIAHDFVCDYGCIGGKYPVTRHEGDRLFLEIMLAVGVKPTTAFLMYLAVRIYSIYDGIAKAYYSRTN